MNTHFRALWSLNAALLRHPRFPRHSAPVIEPLEDRIAPAFGAVFELSSLNGSNGFKLSGEVAGDYAGSSVSDAGDINGDGIGDLLIGAQSNDVNGTGSGAVYVIFGKIGRFDANLNPASLDGANGFKISGVAAYDLVGSAVTAAGDINGDGFDDLLIGAYGSGISGTLSGAAYVIFGKGSGFTPNLNLSTLNGTNGFTLSGVAAGDLLGKVGEWSRRYQWRRLR